MNEIIIYNSLDNKTEIEVRFHNETVWLNQYQLAELFQTDRTSILKHIQNIYSTNELDEKSTCAKFAQVRQEGKRSVKRELNNYNLDVILSVGYRVNSKQGTLFRKWATQRLTDYLVKGYSINQKRLEQLQQTIQLITNNGIKEEVELNEAKGLLEIINNYAQSFSLLNKFDSNSLDQETESTITYEIQYEEAIKAIKTLKQKLLNDKQATQLFGNAKDDSFKGTLQNILQTFNGQYLYATIEEQAANLLYLVIKNHPFSDGNKRIGSFLFVWFLEKNKHRFKKSGELKINDNGLTALALLVAQSNPNDKELMVKLIINLINDR